MIAVLVCRCSGAEVKARRFLQDQGIDNWLGVPIHTGRVAAYDFLKTLSGLDGGPDQLGTLLSFISRAGRYVVVLGYDDRGLMWSNIGNSDAKAYIDGERILERFA